MTTAAATENQTFRSLVRLSLPSLCALYVAEVPADVRGTYRTESFTKATYASVIMDARDAR